MSAAYAHRGQKDARKSLTFRQIADLNQAGPPVGSVFARIRLNKKAPYPGQPGGRSKVKKMLIFLLLPVIAALMFGCEKEKIITSTEYIHDIEYLEGPTDTVFVVDTLVRVDTLVQHDSTIVHTRDTIIIVDTIVVASTDTLFITEYVFDTVTVHDTVTVVENTYDTITVVDTIVMQENLPHVNLAFAAMAYHTDPEVLNFINGQFGYSDGWVH